MKRERRFSGKILGALFALAFALSCVPVLAMTAFAADDDGDPSNGSPNTLNIYAQGIGGGKTYAGNRYRYMNDPQAVASVTVGSTTTTYTALEGEGGALEAWTDGSTLTLLADCALTDTIFFDAGSRTFDLGGKTLTSSSNAFSMRGGSLELKDSVGTGKIDATSGSVINLSDKYSGSSVTMSGGTITASGSGGVGVLMHHGTFTMKGGTITGCSMGVQAGKNTEIHLSGSPKITGNVDSNTGRTKNVMIVSGARVTIDGPLGDGAQIGVRSSPQPTGGNDAVIATNDGSFDMHDQLKHFTSDDGGISVKAAETALVLSTSNEPVHYNDGISFTAWTDALAKAQHNGDDSFKASNCLPTAPGNYYLTEDVSLNEQWAAPAGVLNLCLNGKTIQQTKTGSAASVFSVGSGSTLNLYDCGEAGTITHAQGSAGCGVKVESNGVFTMNGGTIRGNSASGDMKAGGVCLDSGSTFGISGSPVISGNDGGNLLMPSGSTIVVSGKLDKSKASIGLAVLGADGKPAKGVFTTGLAEKGLVTTKGDVQKIFKSDVSGLTAVLTNDGKEARLANPSVAYQAWNGSAVVDVPGGCDDYELVDKNTTKLESGKWYVVNKSVTIADNKRIQVAGSNAPAHLIICDGATLTATGGIDVPATAALNVYGQKGNTGSLVATVPNGGSSAGAGIGGGSENPANGGPIAIHGGKVTAKGGAGAAGIGGGNGGSGGAVTVYGGAVDATGGTGAAGIGGGSKGNGGTVTIYGGKVRATSASAAKHAIGYGDGGTKDGAIALGKGVTLGGSENGVDWVDLTKSTSTRMKVMQSPSLAKISIAKAKVTLAQTSYTYDGKAKTPAVKSVVLDGKTLKAGTDYTVSYANNVKVGTATAIVTGKGNYRDSAKATFTIKAAPTPKPTPTPTPTPVVKNVIMHRLYNPNSGEHFYTASETERASLVQLGWSYEGIGWMAPASSKSPVHRLYNPNSGDHHYTLSIQERDGLVGIGWRYEGVGWYSDDAKGTPVYRQFNPNAVVGTHNYTTSKAENDYLASLGWRAEGIGWYGVKSSRTSANAKAASAQPENQGGSALAAASL